MAISASHLRQGIPDAPLGKAQEAVAKAKYRRQLFTGKQHLVLVATITLATLLNTEMRVAPTILGMQLAFVFGATMTIGHLIRFKLRVSLRAWLFFVGFLCSCLGAWHWLGIEGSRAESRVADWIVERGGGVSYTGYRYDSKTGRLSSHEGEHVVPDWFFHLAGNSYFTDLEAIRLGSVTDGDVSRFAAIRRVRNINLRESQIAATGLAKFPVIPGVQNIELNWDQVSPESIEKLKQFKELKSLVILEGDSSTKPRSASTLKQRPIALLRGLAQLEELAIEAETWTAEDAEALATLPRLRRLNLFCDFSRTAYRSQEAGIIKRMAKSRSLEFINISVYHDMTADEIMALAEVKSLKQLMISRGNNPWWFSITAAELDEFRKLRPDIEVDIPVR